MSNDDKGLDLSCSPLTLSKPILRLRRRGFQLLWWYTIAIAISVEEDTLGFTRGAFRRLDPLTPSGALPEAFEESNRSTLHIGAIMVPHDLLDGRCGLVGVIEGNGGHVVMEDMGLDDSVEDMTADEAKLSVDRGRGSTRISPRLRLVMRKRRVGVLEEGDGH